MKCKQVQELMGAYLYGDLSANELMQVRLHMQSCRECASDLESRGRILSTIDDTAPQLSEEEKQNMIWAVKGAVRNQPQRWSFRLRPAPAFALAVLLVAGIAAGTLIGSHSGKSPPGSGQPPTAKAKVKIQEQKADTPSNQARSNDKDSPGTRMSNNTTREEGSESHGARSVRRNNPLRYLPLAIHSGPTNRNRSEENHSEPVDPSKPLKIAPDPGTSSVDGQPTKLPEPKGLNDAQKSSVDNSDAHKVDEGDDGDEDIAPSVD